MISTVDPDTRHAHKSRERRQDGFKAHVVVEPDTGLITNTGLTQASGPANSDATVGVTLLERDPTLDQGEIVEVLADSAYGTGDALAALNAAGHRVVIKPWPLRPTVAGGFTLDDFAHDPASNTVTCPNGVTRPITASGAVVFGRTAAAAHCAHAAPPPPTGAPCSSGRITPCNAPTAPAPSFPSTARPTASTARWSNDPSPG